MMVATEQLSGTLQTLVDARLDTIDRMLMGQVPRQERLAIVREVEAQIFELLQERPGGELERQDVLAVLARLDPPEAYLPEARGAEPAPARRETRARAAPPVRPGDCKAPKVSGILGLLSIALLFLSILGYFIA